jgi:hypothetical protein
LEVCAAAGYGLSGVGGMARQQWRQAQRPRKGWDDADRVASNDVDDQDQAERFYTEVLGFQIKTSAPLPPQ